MTVTHAAGGSASRTGGILLEHPEGGSGPQGRGAAHGRQRPLGLRAASGGRLRIWPPFAGRGGGGCRRGPAWPHALPQPCPPLGLRRGGPPPLGAAEVARPILPGGRSGAVRGGPGPRAQRRLDPLAHDAEPAGRIRDGPGRGRPDAARRQHGPPAPLVPPWSGRKFSAGRREGLAGRGGVPGPRPLRLRPGGLDPPELPPARSSCHCHRQVCRRSGRNHHT